MEDKLCPVDVICICAADGEIRPLRVRMQGEKTEQIRVDIEEVLNQKEIPYRGAESHIFLCRARGRDGEMVLELKYSFRSHSWLLLRRMH